MKDEFFFIVFTGILSMGLTVLLSLPNKVAEEVIYLAFILGMIIRTLFYVFEEILRNSKLKRGDRK